MVIYEDHPIFIFTSHARGVQLGNDTSFDHNGVKEEAFESLERSSRN